MFAKVLLSALVASATLIGGIDALKMTKRELKERQFEAAKRWHVPTASKRATGKNITFSNPKASGASIHDHKESFRNSDK